MSVLLRGGRLEPVLPAALLLLLFPFVLPLALLLPLGVGVVCAESAVPDAAGEGVDDIAATFSSLDVVNTKSCGALLELGDVFEIW